MKRQNKDIVLKKQHEQLDTDNPAGSQTTRELLDQIAEQQLKLQIKSQLVDSMVYQIRTLSNAIIGFSDLLLLEDLSGDQSEYVTEINHAGHGLSALVNEVLDWAQILSGKLVIQKTLCEVSDIVSELDRILSNAAREKHLDYKIVTDPMVPTCIRTDDKRLLRCLVNLAAHAIRQTSEGTIRVHILLEESISGPVVRFDVIDNSEGMVSEKVSRLFDPQQSDSNSDEPLFTLFDMGIEVTAGLPLTGQLLELLDGTVEVCSQIGTGTTISLRVPVGTSTRVPAKEPSKMSPPESSSNSVLLVEDQRSNRLVISLMLESLGIKVDTAVDGEEAVRKVRDHWYSLILMDLKMPNMDGYEATERLRDQGIQTPIVALSATVLNRTEHQQIRALFDGYLTKPVDSRNLSDLLGKMITGFKVSDDEAGSCEEETVVLEYGN